MPSGCVRAQPRGGHPGGETRVCPARQHPLQGSGGFFPRHASAVGEGWASASPGLPRRVPGSGSGPRWSPGLRALGAEVEVGVRSRPPWGRAGDRRDRAALSVPPSPQGFCWMHVGTDQPFTSVSIGACYQVWAVARDGSAFYRSSVSPSRPNGESPRLRRTPCACCRRRHVGSSARGQLRLLPLPGEAGGRGSV